MKEKSPELKRTLAEDAEFKFFDIFGNIIDIIDTYVILAKKHSGLFQKILEMKKEFYDKLKEFEHSGYIAKGKINPESIKKLYEFHDLDWSKDENVEKVKSYLYSLYPKK